MAATQSRFTSVREQAKDRRRAQIIGAARELITQHGGQWTMLDLAGRARVSPMTPYNLLGSKQAIILELVKQANSEFAERIERSPCADALDRLFSIITVTREMNVESPRYYTHLFNIYYESGEREFRRQMLTRRVDVWRGLIQAIQDQGFVRPEIDAESLVGALGHIYSSALAEFSIGNSNIERFEAECRYGFALMLAGAATASQVKPMMARALRFQAELGEVRAAQGRAGNGRAASGHAREPIRSLGGEAPRAPGTKSGRARRSAARRGPTIGADRKD